MECRDCGRDDRPLVEHDLCIECRNSRDVDNNGGRPRNGRWITCRRVECGKRRYVRLSWLKRGVGYCSRDCYILGEKDKGHATLGDNIR